MGAVELIVAIAAQHQRRGRRDARAEQRQQVERRLVGPLQILQYEHGQSSPPQLSKQCANDLMRPDRSRHDLLEFASDRVRDVHQRPERARRAQRRTRAPQHLPHVNLAAAEAPQQRRLPRTGLAADEDQSPRRARPDLIE